jgi:hypothetical protein
MLTDVSGVRTASIIRAMMMEAVGTSKLLLHRVREVPGPNLGWEIGYPEFLWFSSVPPDECLNSTLKLDNDRFFLNPFQFIIHFSLFHSTLYSVSY